MLGKILNSLELLFGPLPVESVKRSYYNSVGNVQTTFYPTHNFRRSIADNSVSGPVVVSDNFELNASVFIP